MPRLGEEVHRGPAVLVPGRPQVDRPLRVLDPEARRLQRRPQQRPPRQVALPLLARRGPGRPAARSSPACTGRGTIMPGMLADRQQLGHHLRDRPATKPGPVAGQVGALGQRVHGQQPSVIAAARPTGAAPRPARPPSRTRRSTRPRPPAHRAPGPRRPGAASVSPVEDLPGRVGRGVQPDQGRPRIAQLGQVVAGDRPRSRPARAPTAYVGIGHARDTRRDHRRPRPSRRRQPGHQLLGADHRQRGLGLRARWPPSGGSDSRRSPPGAPRCPR